MVLFEEFECSSKFFWNSFKFLAFVLVKDCVKAFTGSFINPIEIQSPDRMKTTAGSLALLDAPTPKQDAHIVKRLREANGDVLEALSSSEQRIAELEAELDEARKKGPVKEQRVPLGGSTPTTSQPRRQGGSDLRRAAGGRHGG